MSKRKKIRRRRLRPGWVDDADEFTPDRYPGKEIAQVRVPLEDLHALINNQALHCAGLFLTAIDKRKYATKGRIRKGTFQTSFTAWAAELGMMRQTVESRARRLWEIGLLRWTKPLDKKKSRVFWLPTWPVPQRILAELEAQQELIQNGHSE